MKRVIAAAALFAGVSGLGAGQVFAADLMEPVPVAPAAPLPQPSAFDWTGFYIGATAAYNWGEYDVKAPGFSASRDADGFGGGAYVGYNYALTPEWIIGAEADLMMFQGDSFRVAGTRVESNSPVLSTIRGRVGYAFDRFMVYGTGGLALGWGEAEAGGRKDSQTHVGWTAGAGVEAALTDNITARAEYLYVDTSGEDYSFGGTDYNTDLDGSIVRVGVGYKF